MNSVFEPVPEGTCPPRRPMICTCDDAGNRAAISLRLEVQRRLGVPSTAAWTAALLSLAWDFGCEVIVLSDMWFGVSASANDGTRAYIECDWPFDGVFALWKEAADRSPERLTARGPHADATEAVVWAEALLAEHEALESTSLAHDYACPACAVEHVDGVRIEPRSERCEEGKALWDAYFPPLHALSEMWAQPGYEDAPFSWGAPDDEPDREMPPEAPARDDRWIVVGLYERNGSLTWGLKGSSCLSPDVDPSFYEKMDADGRPTFNVFYLHEFFERGFSCGVEHRTREAAMRCRVARGRGRR